MKIWNRFATAVTITSVIVGGVAVASATTKSAHVTYSACLNVKSKSLFNVGIATTPKCVGGSKRISWNSQGPAGVAGPQGAAGAAGSAGAKGAQGAPGLPGTVLSFAEFYALMPGDNADIVAPGTAVEFPQSGPADGSGTISALSASLFQLSAVGTYDVTFQVPVEDPGQLELVLNGAAIPYSVVGRATFSTQLVGESLITTTGLDSTLSVDNPAGSSSLTITPSAGGIHPASATLVIKQLK